MKTLGVVIKPILQLKDHQKNETEEIKMNLISLLIL